MQSEKT